ncbi:hypothetical protein O3P69_007319 [Scylla paramamosain]|uniref:RING-type domain-containing protein n=1 Tax=Scylla paramamosain TaxID=85552 RepID=A0AAW0V463_SCYPA
MEAQQQACEVVEGVIANICEKLGAGAKEHICLDKLRESAALWMENSCSVPEAIEAISSPLQQDVQVKLEEKDTAIRKIREDLEKIPEPLIVKQNCNQEAEQLWGTSYPRKNDFRTPESCITTQVESVNVKACDTVPDKTSALDCVVRDVPQDSRNKGDSDDDDDDDDDVVIISTVPRKSAPLIVLSDDSFEDVSPSTSNESASVMKEMESEGNPKPNTSVLEQDTMELGVATDIATQQRLIREQEVDLKDAENSGFINKNLANLHKDEMTLNERIIEIRNEEKRNIDNIDGEVKDLQTEPHASDRPDFNALQQTSAGAGDGMGSHDADQANHSPSPENLQPRSPNPPAEAKLGLCSDDDSNSASDANLMNFSVNNHLEKNQSCELREDADFICSLLPYFSFNDVHQTLVENICHPDRRAFVLEAYINLAVDRHESVQDDVFQGLWAARKRSHGEVSDSHTLPPKKRKTEFISESQKVVKEQPVNVPHEALPSTSTAGFAPVVPKEPDMARGIDPGTFEPRVVDPFREKWYKEKIDFLCAVVPADREVLWAQVLSCQTNDDVEALMERLMEEQDQIVKTVPVIPQYVENQPSTSTAQPATVAGPSNDPGTSDSSDDSATDEAVAGPSNEEGTDGGPTVDLEEKILTQVKMLSEMFENADPDYLQERCVAISGDDTKFQEIVNELLQSTDYPRIEEYHKRQKRLEIKKKFIEGMSVEEFLEYFEDPEKVFCDTTTNMSNTYKENACTQLQKDLPFHLSQDIKSTLKKHNYHYLPSLRALQENEKLARRKTKRTSNLKEKDMDDIFIKELCYVHMQAEIKEYLWKKEENKRRAFLLAKAANELQECQCCYDDEVLEADMEPCTSQNDHHKFCVNCIRRFVEEEIGQGRTSFRCLEGECKDEFSLTTLQKVMKPSIFSKILERKQLEEIAAADIEDLVACPFCNFQTIMPNPEDKVFKCLNPECMKDSCRYCKEPNHVPLRCEEVEKQHQKDTRVFLENKMTEAIVRVCWKCGKRFIKDDGCNKMVCPCGAMMCYICKKGIRGYDHFDGNHPPKDPKKCPLWSNSVITHAEEVRAEVLRLQEELDPSVTLFHNPFQDLPEVRIVVQ